MREKIFDVLFYLIDQWKRLDHVEKRDHAELIEELEDLEDFNSAEIYTAFGWLSALERASAKFMHDPSIKTASLRVFSPLESLKLDSQCRGYLLFLEQAHILTPLTREMVIDRALAVEGDELTLEKLKWVTLLVLMHQRQENESIGWVTDFLLTNDHKGNIH